MQCACIGVFLSFKKWHLKAKRKEMKRLNVLLKNGREGLRKGSTEMVYKVTTVCPKDIYFLENFWLPYNIFFLWHGFFLWIHIFKKKILNYI